MNMIPNVMVSLLLLLTLTVTTLGRPEEETVTVDRRYNVLNFGGTTKDYITLRPNMQPVQQALSVCTWLKKRRSGGYQTWFHYATNTHNSEIRLADSGSYSYNYIHNKYVFWGNKITVGSWAHYCITWSSAAGTLTVYINGALVRSVAAPSGALELDGVLVLGGYQTKPGGGLSNGYMFGGELYKLNVYDKVLTATEVKEMADGGRCSEVEEKYGLTRYLKWEDILLQERHGNVTEQDAGCQKAPEEDTNKECECSGQQNASHWDILKHDNFYNKTLTHDLLNQLRAGWNMLEDFVGATVNDRFIRHFKLFHSGKSCGDA